MWYDLSLRAFLGFCVMCLFWAVFTAWTTWESFRDWFWFLVYVVVTAGIVAAASWVVGEGMARLWEVTFYGAGQ